MHLGSTCLWCTRRIKSSGTSPLVNFYVVHFFHSAWLKRLKYFSISEKSAVIYTVCYVIMSVLQLFYEHLMDGFISRQIMSGSDICQVTKLLALIAFLRLYNSYCQVKNEKVCVVSVAHVHVYY